MLTQVHSVINKTLWALAAWKYFNGAFKIIAMGLQGAFATATWNEMTNSQRFVVVICIAVQLGAFTDSFIDTTASKIVAGKPPVGTNGSGHTQLFSNPDPIKQTETKQ